MELLRLQLMIEISLVS
jgi:hypothetical protein